MDWCVLNKGTVMQTRAIVSGLALALLLGFSASAATVSSAGATVAPVRAGVERLFGTMKRAYGHRRVRYLGLARNDVQLQALCAAINLRRALVLGLA